MRRTIFLAGGAYVQALFAWMYAPLRRTHTKERNVCPLRRPIPRGAYITTRGVVTYAPPAVGPSDVDVHFIRVRCPSPVFKLLYDWIGVANHTRDGRH